MALPAPKTGLGVARMATAASEMSVFFINSFYSGCSTDSLTASECGSFHGLMMSEGADLFLRPDVGTRTR